MAHVLTNVDMAMGRDSFAPDLVLAGLMSFTGWPGTKMVMDWRGLMFWHTHSCKKQACVAGGTLATNIERCPTLRVLLDMATQGIRPSLWINEHADVTRLPTITKPYEMTRQEQHEAAAKHNEFEEAGVLRRVSKRAVTRDEKLGNAASSAFAVVKWKAINTPEAADVRNRWAEDNPLEVAKYLAGDNRAQPPTSAFKPKWRVVYDFKSLNLRTIKLPMTYGFDTEAWARVKPGATLAVLDVKDGFTAVPVAPGDTNLFNVRTDGQEPCQLLRMPFGYRLAPFFFCIFSAAVAEAVASAYPTLVDIHMYMDDALLVILTGSLKGGERAAASEADVARDVVNNAIAIMADCGANVSPEKIEGPAVAVDYLGLRIAASSDNVHLHLPDTKWFTLTQLMNLARTAMRSSSPTLPRGAIDSLAGKIQALSHVIPLLKADLGTIYSLKRKHEHGKFWAALHKLDPIRLEPKHVQALHRLFAVIHNFKERVLFTETSQSAWPTLFGAVDASGEGGLGGHVRVVGSFKQKLWSLRASGAKEGDEWVGMSTFFELLAIEAAISEASMLATQGWKRLVLAADSQAAAAIVKKGYSTRSAEANTVCTRIETALWESKTILEVFWIPRRFNWRADILSHPGDHTNHDWAQSLPETVSELMQLPSPVQSRSHRREAIHTQPVPLRSSSHPRMDLPRTTQEQHGSMEQSPRHSTGYKDSVPFSSSPLHRSPEGEVAEKTRTADQLRIPPSRLRKVGRSRCWQVHYQNSLRHEVAGNAGSRPAQGHEDELAPQSSAAAQTFTRDKTPPANLPKESSTNNECSQEEPSICSSTSDQSHTHSGLLRHVAGKRVPLPIGRQPDLETQEEWTSHQRKACRQNTPLYQSVNHGASQRQLVRGSTTSPGQSSDSQGSSPTAYRDVHGDAQSGRERGDKTRLENSGLEPRLHQTGGKYVLAAARNQQGTDTQAGGLDAQLVGTE